MIKEAIFVHLNGGQYYISEALLTAEGNLPDSVKHFQRVVLRFVENLTLNGSLASSLAGIAAPSSITRSIKGKETGGYNGEDRKNYPLFIGRQLSYISSHLLTEEGADRAIEPDMRTKIKGSFDAALSRWPRWILEDIQSSANRELKKPEEVRRATGTKG